MDPKLIVQLLSYVLWFPLKILGIAALLRVGVRRYALIFTYSVATFLFAAAELPLSLTYHSAGHGGSDQFRRRSNWHISPKYRFVEEIAKHLFIRTSRYDVRRRSVPLHLVADVSKRSEQAERTGDCAPGQFWKSLARRQRSRTRWGKTGE